MQRRALIKAVGQAAYGTRWQMPMAKDMKIGLATLKRWVVGVGVPDDLEDRLIDLLQLNIRRRQQENQKLQVLAIDISKRRKRI